MTPARLLIYFLAFLPLTAAAQNSFIANWQARATRAQSEQPHWVTPLATVTPRLEQEFRADFLRETTPTHATTWIYDNGKGLELIPVDRVELLFNLPPCVTHSTPASKDGAGDVSFLGKYRIVARNEEHGNYILTAFIGGSIPTGSYVNGAQEPSISTTLAGGFGVRHFDVQSTLGATLPTARGAQYGRPIAWNTAIQYKIGGGAPGTHVPSVWPEVEFNTTHYEGGANDGKTQNFATPGAIVRFPLRKRLGLVLGFGDQIATSSYHSYNHGLIFTARLPF
jgi:hypothetical protein